MKAISFSNIQETSNYISSKKDKGFVIYTTNENVTQLSLLNLQNVVCCSTAGEYTPQGYKNGVVTGFEYDINDAEVVEILYPPIKSLDNLKNSYKKVENNSNAFVLLLCDGLSGMEETIITTFYFTKENFKIIGGSAGDNLNFKETLIYIGSKRVHSVAIFFNSKTKTHILKENIYEPTGKKLLITDADTIKRTVKTFNTLPAATAYANALNINESDLPNHFMNHPLGKMYNDSISIVSPMKVNKDKSITFYSQLLPNTFVQILKPVDPIAEIKKTLSNVPFSPSYVLAINCILRSLKFQQDGIWKSIDKEILNFCPNTSGFISYGEQFYKVHSNQTMVLLLVQ